MKTVLCLFICATLLTVVVDAFSTHYDPSLAWSSVFYAKAACCDGSHILNASWKCESCAFNPSFEMSHIFDNATWNTQIFTGYDHDKQAIVVSCRGTQGLINWMLDFDFKLRPYPGPKYGTGSSVPPCTNCTIHTGFYFAWETLADRVMNDVSRLYTLHSANGTRSVPILMTGHSLGAVTSVIASLDIIFMLKAKHAVANPDLTIYNFGEPRAGNPALAAWIANHALPKGKQFRVTHTLDPVPHLPPMIFGYLHAPHELWYDNNSNKTWKDCNDSATHEDPLCSDSIWPIDPLDHMLYLGVYMGCNVSITEPSPAQKQELIEQFYGPGMTVESVKAIVSKWRKPLLN